MEQKPSSNNEREITYYEEEMQVPELLLERGKLNNKILLLKGTLMLLLICIVGYLYSSKNPTNPDKKPDYLGLIKIENEIFEDSKFDKMLDDIEKSNSIKGLVIQINSPGGSSGASEKIYHKLSLIRKKIPIVSSISSLGASGAYLIALSSDRIFAQNMSLTGSIGVVMQTAEIVELAEKLGIKFKNYKSSEFKAAPSPMEVSSPQVDKAIMDIISDSHSYFIELVALNRKIDNNEAAKLADGRIYTGRQAVSNKLVDEIGTLENAIEWIKKEKNLDNNIELREIEPKKKIEFLDMLIDKIGESSKAIFNNASSKLMSVYK